MPLRDIVLTLVLMGILPLILYRPHVGILAWAWVAFMNPHREVYSFLQNTQLNLIIAVLTVVALLFARERLVPRLNATLVLMILLLGVWGSLTTALGLNVDYSYQFWDRNIKTLLLAILVAAVMTQPVRMHALVLIIVISIGYWGTIVSLQSLASLGSAHLIGPPGTMIADNNHLALALVMVLPLLEYCRHVSADRLVRLACIAGMLTTIIAVLGTYSRGGFIALAAVMVLFLWRTQHRMIAAAVVAASVLVAAVVLPQQWSDRMATIQTATEEGTFQARMNAWRVALNIGLDRPLVGAGYRATEVATVYARYKTPDDAARGRAVHNAYLQVLADQGVVGLLLFGLMFLLAILNCRWVRRTCAPADDMQWLAYLASMLEISLLGFAIGSAALSMAYYDVFLVLVVLSASMKQYVQVAIQTVQPATVQVSTPTPPSLYRTPTGDRPGHAQWLDLRG